MRGAMAVVMVLTASCDLFALGPEIVCDEGELGGLSCDDVLEAAGTRLADVGEITRLTVADGVPCPADEVVTCPDTPAGGVATVYAHLSDRSVVAVPVYRGDDGGPLEAGPIQDMGTAP
jgi:hypothetical protein